MKDFLNLKTKLRVGSKGQKIILCPQPAPPLGGGGSLRSHNFLAVVSLCRTFKGTIVFQGKAAIRSAHPKKIQYLICLRCALAIHGIFLGGTSAAYCSPPPSWGVAAGRYLLPPLRSGFKADYRLIGQPPLSAKRSGTCCQMAMAHAIYIK